MRPPHYAGENEAANRAAMQALFASMRPPHYAGENDNANGESAIRRSRFNEAPALRGGKRQRTAWSDLAALTLQ